jgi:hypothetical protein
LDAAHGGGLRKLPNSLMRCIGQVIVVKWEVKSIHVEFERMDECPWCLVPCQIFGSCDDLKVVMIVPKFENLAGGAR